MRYVEEIEALAAAQKRAKQDASAGSTDADIATADIVEDVPEPAPECKLPADCPGATACIAKDCIAGKCVDKKATSGTCDDKKPCTIGEQCSAQSECTGGQPNLCDDGNVCTKDACASPTGCSHAPLQACDDGNACTVGDACVAAGCAAKGIKDCGDGNSCTNDSCDPAKGCAYTNNTTTCSDGNACTTGDKCTDGACKGPATPPCDDGNPCTTDTCAAGQGCTNVGQTGANCSDGSACTSADTCAAGVCKGGAVVNCDDGSLCTDDSCDAKSGCKHANNSAPCDDSSVCTTGDKCNGGACKAGSNAVCDDKNPCTDDTCDPVNACVAKANLQPCDDGKPCTSGDVCADGTCTGPKPTDCNDDNTCTVDVCGSTGCGHLPVPGSCDDGNAATCGDTCGNGKCVPGPAATCDDSNPCTDDSCDSAKGCVHAVNTKPCDDGSACTEGDVCAAASCKPGAAKACDDGNACTDDKCDKVGGCIQTANGASCSDGDACTSSEVCKNSACQGGSTVDCNDKTGCTVDACDKVKGCTHTVDTTKCEANGACFIGFAKDAAGDCKPVSPELVLPERCAGIDLELDNGGVPVVGTNSTGSSSTRFFTSVGGKWQETLGPVPTIGRMHDLVRTPTGQWYDHVAIGHVALGPSFTRTWGGSSWAVTKQTYVSWNWVVLLVDPGNAAKLHEIGQGDAGTHYLLNYSTMTGGVWNKETIVANYGAGKSVDGFDAAFNPVTGKLDVVASVSLAPNSMRVDHITDASGTWVPTTVTTVAAGGAVARSVSFRHDAAGNIHGAFAVNGPGDVHYVTNVGGKWQTTVIDSADDVGGDVVARLDAAGKLHVFYHDATLKRPRYATNKFGAWVVRTLPFDVAPFGAVTGGDARQDLEIDAQGKLHIVFANHTTNELSYFKY